MRIERDQGLLGALRTERARQRLAKLIKHLKDNGEELREDLAPRLVSEVLREVYDGGERIGSLCQPCLDNGNLTCHHQDRELLLVVAMPYPSHEPIAATYDGIVPMSDKLKEIIQEDA